MNREKEKTLDVYEIWKRYEQGKDYQHKISLQENTDKFFRFYHGDQWYGINAGDEDLPIENIIKGIIKYKVSVVCQNTMQAHYSPIERDEEGINAQVCDMLNSFFAKMWEKGKMDTLAWDTVKDAAICGEGYLYFGDGGDTTAGQIIDNVNIFFADEKDPDIQEQRYIIIRERRFVKDLREEALENGISEQDAGLILPDEESTEELGDKQEQTFSANDGKCISLLYMYKDREGLVHVIKAVRNLIYRPDTVIRQVRDGELLGGLTKYPIVNFLWDKKKNSARGYGEVEQLIPNQLVINKTLARRAIAIKNTAFPKLAYNENTIQNVEDIVKAGAKIGFSDGNGIGIGNMIGYINPAHTAPDAKNLTDELIQQTRDLAGAGDAATGAVDPTKASGAAIIAVRDQSALPLNEQMARYAQFVEDIAYLWFDIWRAYNPNGLPIKYDDPETGAEDLDIILPSEVINGLEVNVRVDVSRKSAYDRYAQEQSLQNLFAMGAITLEEYAEALDNDAVMPKGKLEDIIRKRGQQEQLQAQMQQIAAENEQLKATLNELAGIQQGAQGMPMGMPTGGMPMM